MSAGQEYGLGDSDFPALAIESSAKAVASVAAPPHNGTER